MEGMTGWATTWSPRLKLPALLTGTTIDRCLYYSYPKMDGPLLPTIRRNMYISSTSLLDQGSGHAGYCAARGPLP